MCSTRACIAFWGRWSLGVAVGLGLTLGLGVGCGKPLKKTSIVEAREASSVGVKKVEIRNTTGKIDVVSMRSLNPRFKVTATRWARAPGTDKSKAALGRVTLRIYRSGATAIVVIKQPADSGKTTYGADLRVLLPPEVEVDVDNRKGDVRVLGMTGRVAVRNVNGSIEARGLANYIKARTHKGDITASGQISSFDLYADHGKVKAYVRSLDALREASSLRSWSGDIMLSLSRSFNANLSATAHRGKITLPFDGIDTVGKTRAGALGKGGKTLSIETAEGNILVLARTYSRIRYMPHARPEGHRVLRHGTKGHGHGHGHGMHRHGRPPVPRLRRAMGP